MSGAKLAADRFLDLPTDFGTAQLLDALLAHTIQTPAGWDGQEQVGGHDRTVETPMAIFALVTPWLVQAWVAFA
jgi:hypothetical protein